MLVEICKPILHLTSNDSYMTSVTSLVGKVSDEDNVTKYNIFIFPLNYFNHRLQHVCVASALYSDLHLAPECMISVNSIILY